MTSSEKGTVTVLLLGEKEEDLDTITSWIIPCPFAFELVRKWWRPEKDSIMVSGPEPAPGLIILLSGEDTRPAFLDEVGRLLAGMEGRTVPLIHLVQGNPSCRLKESPPWSFTIAAPMQGQGSDSLHFLLSSLLSRQIPPRPPQLPKSPLARIHSREGAIKTMRPKTILLVDDEEEIRSVVQSYLEFNGYNVLTAAGATEAIIRAGECEGRLELLITDIVLRGHDGRDLARAARTLHPSLAVLFITGSMMPEPVSLEHPCLTKPFSLARLTRMVSELLTPPDPSPLRFPPRGSWAGAPPSFSASR